MKGNQIKNGLWKNKIVWLDGKMSQVKDFDGGSKFKIKFFVSGKSVWVKNKLIVFSAIDNLVKGASGQAIQNMNLLYNFPEKTGLK